MMRLLFIMLATIGFVLFALANTEHVELSFIVGQTEIRLIFLLMLSFGVGALAALVHQAVATARLRAQKQRERMKRIAIEEAEAE